MRIWRFYFFLNFALIKVWILNDDKEISNQDDRNDDIEYRMIENQVKEMKIKSTSLYILLILLYLTHTFLLSFCQSTEIRQYRHEGIQNNGSGKLLMASLPTMPSSFQSPNQLAINVRWALRQVSTSAIATLIISSNGIRKTSQRQHGALKRHQTTT